MTYAYQLSNIKFSYDKNIALNLLRLNIQAGKITALIGPNGCGKSTLLNLLAFLQTKQQGQINFFSEPVTTRNTAAFIKHTAFVPQKPFLIRGTVAGNLNLSLKFHNIKERPAERIQSVLEKLNISHLGHQSAKTLSGGELQKVALARAIISDPKVLIMDEPFSYLDHNSEHLLEQFIHQFTKDSGKTLIFSTHNRLQGMAIAEDTISLVRGKTVSTPLINVFHGSINKQTFDTGKIQIMLTDYDQDYQHVSIDPHEIVLSREPLVSSMRNQFKGTVSAIADETDKIRVTVKAGESFQVLITRQSLKDLDIALGEPLWIHFKSNSILAF